MEADVGQPGSPQERLEGQGRAVAAPEWLTGGIGEDEVVAGQPATGRPQRTGLAIAVGSQYIEGGVGQLDETEARHAVARP